MHIIIAGGSGLIGRQLASAFLIDGDNISILSRHPEQVREIPAGVRLLQWDGRNYSEWGKEIDNSDVVINLVGENLSGEHFIPMRWTDARKEKLINSRVDAGKALTKAIQMAQHKPGVFIQASGVGIYGTKQNKVLIEDDASGDDFLANLSKEWEASSKDVEKCGVRRVIIRSGVVLTMQGSALPRLSLPYQLFVGGKLGNGKQFYSWIHLEDEVNAIKFIIHNPQASGVINLTSPNPVTNEEFGRTIGKVIKRPHYLPIPAFVLRIALGEVASVVLEGQQVHPDKLLKLGYVFKFPSLDEALTDLFSK